MLYVNYTINGVNYQAGHYHLTEADAEKRDIQGYACVEKVYLSSVRDERRTLIGDAG
jgi:hypothetical protein